MEGWIKLHRKIVDNPYYFSEKFTRAQAWIDLIIIANHKSSMYYNRGVRIEVKRGQLAWGLDKLSERWRWSRGKVERFLNELETDKQIVRQKNNVTTLISIVKYKEYQANDKADKKADGQQTVKQTGDIQECKEGKECKEIIKVEDKKMSSRELCIDFWLKDFHPGWTFTGKQGKEINQILAKIKKIQKGSGDEVETFKVMCQNLPEWYKNKDLGVINSKFNEIIEAIKNGTGTKRKTDELAEQVRRSNSGI